MLIPGAPDLTAALVDRPTLGLVRCGLIALSTLGLLGAGTELAAHGGGLYGVAAWGGLTLLLAATVLLVIPNGRALLVARVLCLVVLGTAAFSVAEHLLAAGDPLAVDRGVSAYWASLSPLTRSWYGAGALGPTTTLAPGMLGQAALLLLLATLGRPLPPATV